jgi:hypothetical protein
MRRKGSKKVPESIINDEPRTLTDADFPIGSVAHQGDLILVRIKAVPKSAKDRKSRQLADGNTQGSRHVLQVGAVFDCKASDVAKAIKAVCPKSDVGDRYIGPVFSTTEGVADLCHPEHGDHLYRGEMVLAVVYQRNLDAEQREQRTQD